MARRGSWLDASLDNALAASDKELEPGSPLTLTLTTTPTLESGWIEIQIDRFDPLTGWQFNRQLRVRANVRSVTWTTLTAGRWRARAAFLGTRLHSPSRSPYVHVVVSRPLPDGAVRR